MTKLEVVQIPIDQLSLDPANARTHPDRNLEAIVASLRRFGQQKPIVVDSSNVVRAGNGTLDAAKRLGWDSIAAVRTDLKGSEAIAYAIADNRTSELADWDNDVLAAQLNGLLADDADLLDAAGFDEDELAKMLDELGGDGTTGEIVEDEIPEPPVDPITKPGDLWLLGEHRLLCGDSTKAEDVQRLMGGARINLAFTSPPYASQRKYDESSGFKPIHPDEYVEWWEPIQQNVHHRLEADGSMFINIKPHCEGGQRHLYVFDMVVAMVRRWSWRFVDELIWHKNPMPGLFGPRLKNAFEPVYHFSTGEPKTRFDNVRSASISPTNVYSPAALKTRQGGGSEKVSKTFATALPSNVVWVDAPSGTANIGHSAAFPIGLPSFFIRAYTDDGDCVYEPFCGSGTTLIAAEQLGRKCYGMEISPQYCDVIVKRWEALTGEKATCQSATHAS
jgi:DNA modification methylase